MKNPFATFSARTSRIMYSIFVFVTLGICLINFSRQMFDQVVGNDQCRWVGEKGDSRLRITDLVHNGVVEQAGIKDGDYLVRIDGKKFTAALDAQRIINLRAGSYVVYTVERNGVLFETRVLILKSINLTYLSQFLLGLGFLIVGFIVVMVKPQGKIQRMFARFSILTMLFFGLSVLNQNRETDPLWQLILLGTSFIIASVFAPPAFVRFFLYFPVKRKGYNHRTLNIFLYALSTILTICIIDVIPLLRSRMIINSAFFFRYAFYFTGFVIFIRSYFSRVEKEKRTQLRPILFGVAIGICMFAYALAVQAINPFAAFLNPTILFPVLLLVMVPLFFGYAIFRHRLMDVDLVIRNSLIYGAVTASLAAIYLVTVYGIGFLINSLFGKQEDQLLTVVSIVVVAFVFDPVKQRFQNGIDRMFFRERYDYQQALLEFTQELPRLLEMDHIIHSLVQRLSSTMHIEKLTVFVCDAAAGCAAASKNVGEDGTKYQDGEHTLMALLRKTHGPVDLHLLDDEYDKTDIKEEERKKIIAENIVLSVPMFLKERLIGFINVGPKMSGKIYSREDMNLLATVAGQAAIAIDNARLHKLEIEQQRMREELELARTIQQGLFPKVNPDIQGLDISGVSVPAFSVGGDYYDFIQLGPKKLLTVVADVSGKGMSAALYMSKIQGMVQLAAHMYEMPKEMLNNINRRIFDGIDRKSFITMILALFDCEKKEVRICRAGHNKALMISGNTVQFLEGGGIGLGLEHGPVFEDTIEEIVIPMKSAGTFLFYTDGVTEAMNERLQQLGEEALVDSIRSFQHLPSRQIQQNLLAVIEQFRGSFEQHDDVTMVVVKV